MLIENKELWRTVLVPKEKFRIKGLEKYENKDFKLNEQFMKKKSK